MATTEKELDVALENEFKTNSDFRRWFLSRTKFAMGEPQCVLSRSNHPWGPIPYTVTDPATGRQESLTRESETDVLLVCCASSGQRFALHIENKLANGRFEPLQAELYSPRGKHWLRREEYGYYEDFETILVAPCVFYECNKQSVDQHFDRFVAHEDIAAFIPLFGIALQDSTTVRPKPAVGT